MRIQSASLVSFFALKGVAVNGFQTSGMLRPLLIPTSTQTSSLFSTNSKDTDTESSSSTPTSISWETRKKCWRPVVSDVERISFGKPAKKKGTGSRGVPHRLNEEERMLFDNARRKGFLEVGGSGWRSQRRDAPLINTYRSLCDARSQACIVLHKGNTGLDELVVDLSPLRLPDIFEKVETDIVGFVGIPTSYSPTQELEGLNTDSDAMNDEDEDDDVVVVFDENDESWDSRPIYQLPPYSVAFQMQRAEGKALGKILAGQFKTIEAKASKSKKPNHVRPGKNRRSGGYGIG